MASASGRSIINHAMSTPFRAALVRYGGTLAIVAASVLIFPLAPLDGRVGQIFAIAVILASAWFGGLGPALLFIPLIVALERVTQKEPEVWFVISARQLVTYGVMTILTSAVGLAGQYQRRIRAVTQRHAARMREQSRALSLAHIIFRDLEGRITTWNEGAERMFGWTSEEAQGRVIHELLKTQFPKPLPEIRAELLRNGQWQGEVIEHHRDGRALCVATHCILYHSEDGAPPGVAEVHNDVTELRRAEEAIRDADRRKDQFLATLAHELRNPLAPIRNGLDVLRLSHNGSHDQRLADEMHQMMLRQIDHMVRLIDDLLDVSRINTGRIELQRERVAVADVLRDAIESSRPHIDAAGQELVVSIPDEALVLEADRARLTQVVLNLLDNATKYTPRGGRITLSAALDRNAVEIRVRDTGVGIPSEMLTRIFDMFTQVENLVVRSHGGLGIGLSIARTLVQMHGGTVEARSEGRGRGSEFVVRLPLPEAQQPRRGDEVPSAPAIHGSEPIRRILVVDDNQDAARSLAMLLNTVGCECHSAFDGPGALEAATEFQPDAFVLDIGMPGMSGFEVARRIRAVPQFRDALLIAVTGWGKDDDRRQSREAGFDHHLVKPVQVAAICELLKAVGRNGAPVPAARG